MQPISKFKTLVNPTPPATVILQFQTWTGSTPPTQIFVHGRSEEESDAIHRYLAEQFAQPQR